MQRKPGVFVCSTMVTHRAYTARLRGQTLRPGRAGSLHGPAAVGHGHRDADLWLEARFSIFGRSLIPYLPNIHWLNIVSSDEYLSAEAARFGH
jgi:hypothetical protein